MGRLEDYPQPVSEQEETPSVVSADGTSPDCTAPAVNCGLNFRLELAAMISILSPQEIVRNPRCTPSLTNHELSSPAI